MTTLKSLREENKKTAAEVSTVLGVTVQALYRYENGTRSISLEQIIPLAELYNCTEREVIEAQLNSRLNAR